MYLIGPLTSSRISGYQLLTIAEYKKTISTDRPFKFPITHIFLLNYKYKDDWIKILDTEYRENLADSELRILSFTEEEFTLFLLRYF